mmetsp:Transcript_18434/g.31529  ORF Transcript_18434/g.31529 Transcript_18434/m.31529 type:complete len:96 (-) Transcript_18434:17-304(-)
MEDSRAIDQAKRASEARKTMKDFKKRHGSEIARGDDARSHKTMIEKKKQKLMSKTRESKSQDKSKVSRREQLMSRIQQNNHKNSKARVKSKGRRN